MDDDSPVSTDGKSLTNLRVIDLKQELEKRGLSKSGSKKDLVKRLKQQIEFEKLCEDRKSTGDRDLKLGLDAVTEQNEFVQQYLAQQQKIYAEQQEVKRLVELEEIQKSGDERESCEADSLGEENDEKSVSSSETEEQNKNECNEKCDTTSGESAEPSSSETVSERNSDDFIHIEVLQEESLTNTRSKVSDSLQESVITSMVRHKKRSSGSNVPYSISDIQLPDSPGECLKSVSKHKASEDKIEVDQVVIQKFGGSDDCEMISNVASHIQADKDIKRDRDQQDSDSTDPVRDSSSLQNSEAIRNSKSGKPILNIEIKEKFAKVCSNDDDSQNIILGKDFDTEQNVDSNDNQPCRSKRNSNLNESDTESETKSPQSKMEVEQDNEDEKKTTSQDNSNVKHPVLQHIEDEKDTTSQDNETEKSSESDDQTDSIQTKSHIVRKRSKRKSSESSSESSDSSPERKVYAKHGKDIKSQSLNCRVTKESKSPESQNSEEIKESKSPESQNSNEMKESKSPTSQNSEETKEPSATLVNEAVPVTKAKNNEEKLSLPVSISSRRLKLKRNNIAMLENKKIETQIKDDSTENQSMDTTVEEAPLKEPEKFELSHMKAEHSQEKHKPLHEKIKPPQDKHKPSHMKIRPPQDKDELSQVKVEPSQVKPEPSQEKPETSMEKLELSQQQPEPSLEKPEPSQEKPEPSQEKPEPSQEKPNSPEKPVELIMPKMTNRKLSILSRKLNRKSSEEDKSEETGLKKSRWGSYTSSLSRSSISISSDSLKKFIPDFKLITGPISSNDMDDPFNPVFPSEPSPVATEPKLPNFTIAKEVINEEAMEEDSKLVVSKPLPVQKEHETEQRPIKCPSPQGPVSKIVFIQNLVRPFTILQLKELLKQTGNMVEESFWTDRIKSKCFVQYETEEEALKTREALNGARWPSSNPKILSVEFATQEELDQQKNGSEGPHAMSQRPIPTLAEVRDTRTVLALPIEDHRKKQRDRRKEAVKTKPQLPMREWDKDKISQETPERERGIASGRERERGGSRSAEKKDKKDSKRTNEDTPAKLLDDLFQKTKSSPCIYWLPLTEEQVKQKEEDRRLRVLAREKKNQQQKEEESAATATTTTRRTKSRPSQKSHDKESRRSQTRSRSPVTRRR